MTDTPGDESSGNKSNTFKTALQVWSEIDLSSLQKQLDEQGIELKEHQKSSLLSRKTLATKTKEFKKLPDDDKLDQFKTLLKLYQNEIDSLTNKNKTIESYFFGLYRKFSEAPDPRPLLEVSLDAVIESSEAEQLKSQLVELQDKLARTADYDVLKQRLLETEQKSAELLSSKLRAKDEEFKSLLDEKQSNWSFQEANLNNQIKEAQKQIEELRTSKEVTELQLSSRDNQTNNQDHLSSASILAELDIVTRDAESSKKRIFELEKRNEKLRSELTKFQSNSVIDDIKHELSKKISELESENVLLLANINQSRNKLDELSKEQLSKQESFKRETEQLTLEIKNLKDRLVRTNDYDEIKSELNLMKQIEFGQEDEGDDESSNGLDSQLLNRNKLLTQEVAEYRSQHDDLNNKIGELTDQLVQVSDQYTKAQALNEKLERDLTNFQDSNRFNDNASIISSMTRGTTASRAFGRNGSISEEPNNSSSILPIITKQRDRFRERNAELEEEHKKSNAIINELKRQVNNLKSDNEELYERTRYVASFNEGNRVNNKKLLRPKPNIDYENNPYQQSYETKIHPLEQFRMREQERIHAKLSPIERLFISFTRAILATRTTRMLFLIYCVGLHCIVMLITVYASSLHTAFVPEVGLNVSTGGVASGQVGTPDTLNNVFHADQ